MRHLGLGGFGRFGREGLGWLGVDGWGAKDKPAFRLLEATEEEAARWFDYINAAAG